MTTSSSTITRDRRHHDPVVFAGNLRLGDVFLDPSNGHHVTFDGSNADHLDPATLVNLDGRR